jgi:hypothetical protein
MIGTLILAGCSAHQNPPSTPYDSAKTPTFRSSSYSDEPNNTPNFTQPGQNHGHIVHLPDIPHHDRWDQNAPLAIEVYGAISNLGRDKINYVMVQAKGSTVMVGGTVGSDDLKNKILAIAKSSAGVKNVVSELKVQNE